MNRNRKTLLNVMVQSLSRAERCPLLARALRRPLASAAVAVVILSLSLSSSLHCRTNQDGGVLMPGYFFVDSSGPECLIEVSRIGDSPVSCSSVPSPLPHSPLAAFCFLFFHRNGSKQLSSAPPPMMHSLTATSLLCLAHVALGGMDLAFYLPRLHERLPVPREPPVRGRRSADERHAPGSPGGAPGIRDGRATTRCCVFCSHLSCVTFVVVRRAACDC